MADDELVEMKGLDLGKLLDFVTTDEGQGLIDGLMGMKGDAERFVTEMISRLSKIEQKVKVIETQNKTFAKNQRNMFNMIKDIGELTMKVKMQQTQIVQKLKKLRLAQIGKKVKE